jgi:cell division GTPase FtsZ
MNIGLIAVGQAGGKITDAILEYQYQNDLSFVADALAVNTAEADLLGLRHVPADRQILIGQSRVKGHGAGADNELGAELAREDLQEVIGALDQVAMSDVDAILIVAALGGGTGSGGAPVIARRLRELLAEPVYGLAILPTSDEGGIYNLNAARSLQTFVREVDNLILFDNDAWRQSGESLQSGYARINQEMARRIGVLMNAGEARNPSPDQVVDASEIINTLGAGGVTTVGYASSRLGRRRKTFGSGYRKIGPVDDTEGITRITSSVRQAALGRLSVPAELTSAERVLFVVSGPPEYLSRKGIDSARDWLEEATGCMEIRAGDYPIPDTDYVAALLVLAGVTDIPRVKELQAIAVEAQHHFRERDEMHMSGLEDLLSEESSGIEPLF